MNNTFISDTKLLSIIFEEILYSGKFIRNALVRNPEASQKTVILLEKDQDFMDFERSEYVVNQYVNITSINFQKAVHRQFLPYVASKRILERKDQAAFILSHAYNTALLDLSEKVGSAHVQNPRNEIKVEFLEIPSGFAGYEMITTLVKKDVE